MDENTPSLSKKEPFFPFPPLATEMSKNPGSFPFSRMEMILKPVLFFSFPPPTLIENHDLVCTFSLWRMRTPPSPFFSVPVGKTCS